MQRLSDTFPIQNGVKRGDDLLPLLFNLAAEYTIGKVEHVGIEIEWDTLAFGRC
jgi:hypothetical protein